MDPLPAATIHDGRISLSWLLRHMKALDALDKWLEEAAGLDSAIAEAKRTLEVLMQAQDEARSQAATAIADANRRAKQTDEQAMATATEASRNAAALLDEARATAGDVIADARERAKGIIAAANAEGESIAAQHADQKTELATLGEAIRRARLERDAVHTQWEEARAQLAQLKQAIADLKAKF